MWAAVALVGATILIASQSAFKSRGSLPAAPGPNRTPFFGNALQIDNKHPVVQFKDWATQYGPVMSLRVFSQDIVVINSDQAAKDLLDAKGSIYSSRAPPYFGYNLMSKSKRMVFHPYGDEWRKARKIMHRLLAPTAMSTQGTSQELESRQMLKELMDGGSPKQILASKERGVSNTWHFFDSFKRFSSSSIMTLCYGHRFVSSCDPTIVEIFEAMDTLSLKCQPGAYLVDALPILRKLPTALQPWVREAKELHEQEWKTWGRLLDRCKKEVMDGTARECFIGDLLREGAALETEKERQEAQLTDLDIGYAACALLEAGSDTTASTIASACLAMILHPNVLAKAHAELDRVVGSDRLPALEDEEHLPYVRACIKETLRWRPPTVMGVPHAVVQDDVYNGFHIPKDAMIIDNIYAMSHDPKRFANPEVYDPERFHLSHPGTAAEYAGKRNVKERDHFAYGHGRRICAGIHMAEKSLYMAITRILWAFDIARADGADEIRADPHDERYTDGFVSFPNHFGAKFTIRDDTRRATIENEFKNAIVTWESEGLEAVS
ncbi:cytochrome P450 [Ceraceosorus guamensis]|uniref:Cytochrome P450 n=1 Tax=Ceraceosorus guamensis TaxID=1522189 RepID=A0A316VQM6_9BASI|nr:cytochrome P450 [Ceraceosorus guamensis]PWN39822.1 cytochrome P450 [Ceraceosorus guamensis]